MNCEKRRILWGLALTALTMALTMIRLGKPTLWLDEGLTGLLGSHILKFGLPRVQDGTLLIHEVAGDSKDGLWIWDGWLQFYLSAAGQAIFGQTAFGARFFHAFAGAVVPWAAYPLFRSMSTRRGVPEAAALLTALSVPLLLSARQAHYYPEGTLLTILAIRAYHSVLESRRYAATALTATSVLLFHAHSVWFVALGLAFAAHILILRPPASVFKHLALSALATVILVAPFALWARVWMRVEQPGGSKSFLEDPYVFLAMSRHYLLELNLYGAPVVVLCLGGAAAAGRRRPFLSLGCLFLALASPIVLFGMHTAVELWAFTAVVAFALLLGVGAVIHEARQPPEARGWMPGALLGLIFVAFVSLPSGLRFLALLRYVAPLLPLLAFLTAAAVFALLRRQWLAWPLVVFLVATNAAYVWPVRYASERTSATKILLGDRTPRELQQIRAPRWSGMPNLSVASMAELWQPLLPPRRSVGIPLRDYLVEFSRPYRTPDGVAAEYINSRKRPGDRFAHHPLTLFPVAFHTGLAPERMALDTEPPRFLLPGEPGSYDFAVLQAWMTKRRYRKVVLKADVGPLGQWPEPDAHFHHDPHERLQEEIWERVDTDGAEDAEKGPSGS